MHSSIYSKLRHNRAAGEPTISLHRPSKPVLAGYKDDSRSRSLIYSPNSDEQHSEREALESHKGLQSLYTSDNAIVDIVAVHGLGGHSYQTWTHEDGSMWLRDFLPEQLPNSNIMTFGYDSQIGSNSVARIPDVANSLLNSLYLHRSDEETSSGRPIIFICHSLGGIVVKKALVLAHSRGTQYRDILDSTKSIAFLSVPHNGADIASWATKVAQVGMVSNKAFVEELKKNSSTLNEISTEFIDRGASLKIYSFYETRKTLGLLIVDQKSAKLNAQNEHVWPIDADHRQICRASSPKSEVVRATLQLIKQSVDDPTLSRKKSKQPEFYEVPNRLVPKFFGRDDVLEELDSRFSGRQRQCIVALLGMGGQGKSQVALKYCDRRRSSDLSCAVFFIDASSKSSVRAGYQSLAHRLRSGSGPFNADEKTRIDYVKSALRRWESNWLLVFDNYENPAEFLVQDFIPTADFGDVLITSRHRDVGELAESLSGASIDLPGLDEKSALRVLIENGKNSAWGRNREMSSASSMSGVMEATTDETLTEHAQEIVSRLGYHPLAITLAAAFIKKRQMPLVEFLDIFDARKTEILGSKPSQDYRKKLSTAGRLINDDGAVDSEQSEVPVDVWTTWELSYQQIGTDQTSKDTKEQLLTFLAFFGSDAISERYLAQFIHLKVLSSADSTISADSSLTAGKFSNHGSSSIEVNKISESAELLDELIPKPKYSISSESMSQLEWLKAFTDSEDNWRNDIFREACISLSDLSLIQYAQREDSKYLTVTLHPLVREWIQLKTERQRAQKIAVCTAILLCSSLDRGEPNIAEETFFPDKNKQLVHISGMDANHERWLASRSEFDVDESMRIDYLNVTHSFADYLAERAWHGLSIRFRERTLEYTRELYGDTSEEAMSESIETVFQCFFAQDHKRVQKITGQFVEAYGQLFGTAGSLDYTKDLRFQRRQSLFWLFVIRCQFAKAQNLLHEKAEMLRRQARAEGFIEGWSPEDHEVQSLYLLRGELGNAERFFRKQLNARLKARGLQEPEDKRSRALYLLRSGFSGAENVVQRRLESKYGSKYAIKRLFPKNRPDYKSKKSVDHLEKVLSHNDQSPSRRIDTYPDGYMELRHGFLFLQGFYLLRNELDSAEDLGFHMYKMSTRTFGDDEMLMEMSFMCFLVMIRRARALQSESQNLFTESKKFWVESRQLWRMAVNRLEKGFLSEDPGVLKNIIPWGIVIMGLRNEAPETDEGQKESEVIVEEPLRELLTNANPIGFPRLLTWLQMIVAIFQGLHFTRERVQLGLWMTDLSEQKLGSSHPLTISNQLNLAIALHDEGRLEDAVERLSFARNARPNTLESSMNSIIEKSQGLIQQYERELRGDPCTCPAHVLPLPFVSNDEAGASQ